MTQGERWIIFYTGGDIFTSAMGSPWEAPRRDIQSIASSRPGGGHYNVNQRDYYYYEADNGGWNEANDLFTVWDHLIRADRPLVVFGRMLSDENWKRHHNAIIQYCDKFSPWLTGFSDEPPEEPYL